MRRSLQSFFKPFLSLDQFSQFCELLLLYMLVALPFSSLHFIPGFANLRPVSALIPIYGFFFGVTGAWASGIGNLLFDAISGGLAVSSIGGFIANFFLPLFYRGIWRFYSTDYPQMRSFEEFTSYTILVVVATGVKCLIICPFIAYFYPDVSLVSFVESVYTADGVFSLFPGAALLILIGEHFETDRTLRHSLLFFRRRFIEPLRNKWSKTTSEEANEASPL